MLPSASGSHSPVSP